MKRPVIVAVFAAAILCAEVRAQCDMTGTKDVDKEDATQMEIVFKPSLEDNTATVRVFDEHGVWMQEREVTSKTDYVFKQKAFFPEKVFVAATGPAQSSTVCARGKGTKANFYAPCTGIFVLELQPLKSHSLVIDAPRAAEVNVAIELPRSDRDYCRRLIKSTASKPFAVASNEKIKFSVKKNPDDKPPSTFGCVANVAAATKGTVPVKEESGRGSASITSRELVSNCQFATVRVK